MLFKCYGCGQFKFDPVCRRCESQANAVAPLDPRYLPELETRIRGFTLLGRERRKEEKRQEVEAFLSQLDEFDEPYLMNYLRLTGTTEEEPSTAKGHYSRFDLLQLVLVRGGFEGLRGNQDLTRKLLRSIALRFTYQDFSRAIRPYVGDDLKATTRSWIEARGPVFRTDLHMLLYYAYEQGLFAEEVQFNTRVPIMASYRVEPYRELCERIYLDVLVDRFRTTLERFDPDRLASIYAIDAMDGHEFENFLASLYRALGYEVEQTRRGPDQGADLFVTAFGRTTVIQAKNYSGNVGNAAVQQAMAAKEFYRCDEAMVVTNSYFTTPATVLAGATGVELLDRDDLRERLDQYNRTILEAASESDADFPEATEVAQAADPEGGAVEAPDYSNRE